MATLVFKLMQPPSKTNRIHFNPKRWAAVDTGAPRGLYSPVGTGPISRPAGEVGMLGSQPVVKGGFAMSRLRMFLFALALTPGAALFAQTGPDPRENSFQFIVDGTQLAGVIGYQLTFNH